MKAYRHESMNERLHLSFDGIYIEKEKLTGTLHCQAGSQKHPDKRFFSSSSQPMEYDQRVLPENTL